MPTRHLIDADIQDGNVGSSILWSSQKTKSYLDTIVAGLSPKDSVKAATTANISLTAEQTIDDVALVAGDRVLVKNQTSAAQNGIYIVQLGAWTRSEDANTSDAIRGAFMFVEQGTVNTGKMYNLSTSNVTLGSTALTFSPFGASIDLSAYALKMSPVDVEITDFTKGVILRSPDGTRRRVTTGNEGAIYTDVVT